MNCNELKEYLSAFEPDKPISIIIADIEKRIYHKISGYAFIADIDSPVLVLETSESGLLDEVLEEAHTECESRAEYCRECKLDFEVE